MAVTRGEVTELLRRMKQDQDTLDQLTRMVYDDIRQLARVRRKEFRQSPTLQTTAVVHEAFAKLFQGDHRIANRQHLMCLMSRVIRQVIVDHARRQMRQKRGSDPLRSDAEVEELPASVSDAAQVLDLEAALDRLEEVDPELVDLVCGYYFAGRSAQELAETIGVSPRTVHRHLQRASTWLRFELEAP
jgi:RNA polymerase sigma factor (TIGR02999 family)